MKTKNYLLMMTLALVFTACKKPAEDSVLVLGLDAKNEIKRNYIPSKFFAKKMNKLLSNSSAKILEGLETHKESVWKLERVTVGLQLGFEIEIEELIELEFAPAFEMRFQPVPKNLSL